jgi:hypothetical protein
MKTLSQIMSEDARLIILRALLEQSDGRLNSELLRSTLESFGINKTRDWVHEELRWLADMMAVKLTDAGSVRIAELLTKGRDHVERRIMIEGIKRPSPPEA